MSDYSYIPSNPEDCKKIVKVLKEISDANMRIAGEKDFIKEAVADMSEAFEIPKKVLNKWVRWYVADDSDKVQKELEETISSFQQLMEKGNVKAA
ncbi:MAG TPA: hypothetical protein PK317_04845 [Coprothermobacter proteolyticus]|nr:hypothetical protein [Coprothermobacter proteolyticus]